MNSLRTIQNIFLLVCLPMFLHAQVTVAVTPPACNGYTDGVATATIIGGTAPYTFTWSNGQTGNSPILSGVPAGNYSLTCTDNVGITTIKAFTVTQPTPLVPTAVVQGGACAAGATLTYQASATGSTPPYSYVWRNLDNNQRAIMQRSLPR